MEYRAIIQQVDKWWIGWLIDLPGVNAQEKTKEKLIESLKIGSEDLLSIPPELPEGAELEKIEI
jgi:predicted RNase H-like HicB family nuclease